MDHVGVTDGELVGFGATTSGSGFGGIFAIVIVLMVVLVIANVAMAARRAKKLHDAGIDPLDPKTDLQVRWAQSRTTASADPDRTSRRAPADEPPSGPEKTTEERLAEVDRLYAAGTISPSERDAARARILGSI